MKPVNLYTKEQQLAIELKAILKDYEKIQARVKKCLKLYGLDKNKDGVYEPWFNGGLIFYDRGDDGVDKQYSVRIGNLDTGWSIHT